MTVDSADVMVVVHRPTLAQAAEALYTPLIERAMAEAAQFESVETEIALLRIWLKEVIEENPRDHEFISKGLSQIVRAVAVKFRLSPASADSFSAAMVGVMKHMDDAIKRADEEEDL